MVQFTLLWFTPFSDWPFSDGQQSSRWTRAKTSCCLRREVACFTYIVGRKFSDTALPLDTVFEGTCCCCVRWDCTCHSLESGVLCLFQEQVEVSYMMNQNQSVRCEHGCVKHRVSQSSAIPNISEEQVHSQCPSTRVMGLASNADVVESHRAMQHDMLQLAR